MHNREKEHLVDITIILRYSHLTIVLISAAIQTCIKPHFIANRVRTFEVVECHNLLYRIECMEWREMTRWIWILIYLLATASSTGFFSCRTSYLRWWFLNSLLHARKASSYYSLSSLSLLVFTISSLSSSFFNIITA